MKRETSKIAYRKLKDSGKIDSDKDQVYKAMKKLKYATREDVARCLNWDDAKTWRRLSDLKNEGKIEATEVKKVASTGHLQAFYKLPRVKEIKIKVS